MSNSSYPSKTVKTYYTLRPSKDVAERLNYLHSLRTARLGRTTPMSHTIYRALQYGFDAVEREELCENLAPFNTNSTELERYAQAAFRMLQFAADNGFFHQSIHFSNDEK